MRTLGIGIVLTALPTMLAAQIRTPASKSDLVTLAAATGTARTACNNMNGSIKNSCTQLQAGSLGGPTGKPSYTFRYLYCADGNCTSTSPNSHSQVLGKAKPHPFVHALMVIGGTSGAVAALHVTSNTATVHDDWLSPN
jgi:hypothetical protein